MSDRVMTFGSTPTHVETNVARTDNKISFQGTSDATLVYRPEWTDNIGYMGHAIAWARMNMAPDTVLTGVRFGARPKSGLYLANHFQPATLIETFVIRRRMKPRNNSTEIEIVLNLHNGQVVVHMENEIQVYPDNYHMRSRDMVAKYVPHFNSSQKVDWLCTELLSRQTFEHEDNCPTMEREWLSAVADMLDEYWQLITPQLGGTMFDEWTLLSKEQLSNYPTLYVTETKLRYFYDLKHRIGEMRKVALADGEALELIKKGLLDIWNINQSLQPNWRYSWFQWRDELKTQVQHPDTKELVEPISGAMEYLERLVTERDQPKFETLGDGFTFPIFGNGFVPIS